ncbi:MAG: hypothetical protein MZV64_73000 [Ignavibacteriales bacterium]|nr:hypothetical protein [Ignavibacteriales bacterium]
MQRRHATRCTCTQGEDVAPAGRRAAMASSTFSPPRMPGQPVVDEGHRSWRRAIAHAAGHDPS